MDFVLWVSRVMHVISAVVWVGGLIFFNAILRPIVEHEQSTQTHLTLEVLKRFQAFIWSSLWPLLATGLLLMLLSRQFIWFDLSTWWLRFLFLKQLCFVLLLFLSWQMGKVVQQLPHEQKDFSGWWMAYTTLVRRSIVVALVALLSAGVMIVL